VWRLCPFLLWACAFQPPPVGRAADAAGDSATPKPDGSDDGPGPEDAGGEDAPPDGPDATTPECLPASGLVGCWAFEGNGLDGSGNGHDATVGASFVTPGRYGMAVDRDSGSDIHIADAPDMDLARFTLEMWIQSDAAPPMSDRIVLFDKNGQYGAVITATSTLECSFAHEGADEATRAAGGLIPVGPWIHVACSYDGATLRSYLDGAEVASTPSTATVRAGIDPLQLGEDYPSGGDTFDGRIDTVRLWSQARAPSP
jgi:hypothetical protein